MVLASTGWPPTPSLSKVIFGPVIEWWCSCKSDLFFTIQLTAVLAVLVHLVNSSSCPEDILAVYKIRLETFWSEERFPKQYPQWRPPAQWSKTVGRSLCFFFNYYRDVDKQFSKKFKELFLDYACLFRFYSSARVPAFQGKATLKLCAT